MRYQRTIAEKIEVTGEGIFSGANVKVELIPAPANTGIVFLVKNGKREVEIPLSPETSLGLEGNTAVTNGEEVVYLVEHLLSALHALEVDNLFVRVNGVEIPILDGSAYPWVRAIREVGYKFLFAPKKFLKVKKEFVYSNGRGKVVFRPKEETVVKATIKFNHPAIGVQSYQVNLNSKSYINEICFAKTFAFKDELVERLKLGILKGGSPDSVIILEKDGIFNPEVLTAPDEFARHKVLDLVGDLYTLGSPVIGEVEGVCSSHKLHIEAIKAISSLQGFVEEVEEPPHLTFVFVPTKRFRAS